MPTVFAAVRWLFIVLTHTTNTLQWARSRAFERRFNVNLALSQIWVDMRPDGLEHFGRDAEFFRLCRRNVWYTLNLHSRRAEIKQFHIAHQKE